MKGTKKFYNEMIKEIKFHEAEAKKLREDGKLAKVSGLYEYAIGLHDGMRMAIKMVLYKIYPSCELDKDLKQGD